MRYGVLVLFITIFVPFFSWAEPFGLYVKQSPQKSLLTENAYEGFDRPFFMRREADIKTGNSASDGLHINIVRFPSAIFNSSQFKTLKDTSSKSITGRQLEKVYEQKLRSFLKTQKHQRPIYVLAHEALNNDYIKVSSYMGQAEVFNLNQHFILFLTEKPIVDVAHIVSLPLSKITMSVFNADMTESLPNESIEKRMTNISNLSLKAMDKTLTQDLMSEFTGKLPRNVHMEIEYSTLADSEGAKEYFTVEKTIQFSKSCRFLF
ncbi:MAG: hypothetical protein MK008_13110 [Bdellovibrionales bacterium]|nr:hypothetical protein [Bdellovibrionales bacterium]